MGTHRDALALCPWSRCVKTGVCLRAKETETSAAQWPLRLGKDFAFALHLWMLQVIMATNRIETLDPALIRPGRIDRKIEFPLPDEKTKRRIFSIHTNRMTLAEDVSLEDYVMAKDDLSGADIKVIIIIISILIFI